MFEIFGEFDTFLELNQVAEGLKEEGDMASLRKLASENGIDEMDTEAYIKGEIPDLSNPMTAALGKLKKEKEEESGNYVTTAIIGYLESICDDIDMALAIRKKGKRVSKVYDKVYKYAKDNQKNHCGVCSDEKAYQMAREYYKGAE